MLLKCYKVVTETLMMNETGMSEVQLSPHLLPHATPATPYIIPVICTDPPHQVPLATMPLIKRTIWPSPTTFQKRTYAQLARLDAV